MCRNTKGAQHEHANATHSVVLQNDFHNTEVSLRIRGRRLSSRQVKKAKATLCPFADCRCSGELGVRGKQQFSVTADFNNSGAIYVVDCADTEKANTK